VLLPLTGSCGHLRRKVVIETRGRGRRVPGSGAHQASKSVGTAVLSRGIKRPEREVEHWPSAEGKIASNCIFDPPPPVPSCLGQGQLQLYSDQ